MEYHALILDCMVLAEEKKEKAVSFSAFVIVDLILWERPCRGRTRFV